MLLRDGFEGRRRERFPFGENWSSFVQVLSPARITEAEGALRAALGVESLAGRSFLDVGCGSGLFSLAAQRLGAERIISFDFDLEAVATTLRLRDARGSTAGRWDVQRGDLLDRDYMAALGTFDVVYAWGTHHHTGDIEKALRHTAHRVARGGLLFLAVYNDQGRRSRMWRVVKRSYNRMPKWLRPAYVALAMAPRELRAAYTELRAGTPGEYLEHWRRYEANRGMSKWHDMVNWVGGYPFQVARPADVVALHAERGFALSKLTLTRSGMGNNQYLFTLP